MKHNDTLQKKTTIETHQWLRYIKLHDDFTNKNWGANQSEVSINKLWINYNLNLNLDSLNPKEDKEIRPWLNLNLGSQNL